MRLLNGLGLFFCCFGFYAANAVQAVVACKIFYLPDEENGLKLKPYLEIYWQTDPSSIGYAQDTTGWKYKIRTDITIKQDPGMVADEHYILETPGAENPAGLDAHNLIDLHRYMVKPGPLHIAISLSEPGKKEGAFNFTYTLTVAAVEASPFYSDVQLVDTILNDPRQTVFQRNGQQQIPLCTDFLADNRKSIWYYAELYNASEVSADQYPLVQKVFIARKKDEGPTHKLVRTDTILNKQIQVASGKFPLEALGSGNYYLVFILENKNKGVIASKNMFFQLINSHPIVKEREPDTAVQQLVVLDLNKTFVSKYTAPQVRAMLKMLLPIGDPNERKTIGDFIRAPEDMYSRYFIYNFWLTRNKKDPAKAWEAYAEKVKEVNKLFGDAAKAGYETERGTIWLKYGKPSERVRVAQEEGTLPYEIWQYNSIQGQGGANHIFLFYQPGSMVSDFELLHSTLNGEIKNRNWRMSLYVSGAQNPNSKAEQYLQNR